MPSSRLFVSLRWVLLCAVLGVGFILMQACADKPKDPDACQTTADCVEKKGKDYYCDKRRLICRKAACTADTDCGSKEVCQNGSCIPNNLNNNNNTNGEGSTNTENTTTDGGNPTEENTNTDGAGGCTTDEDCGDQICQTNCTAEKVKQCVNGQCVEGSQPCKCATGFQCSQSTGQCEPDVCPGGKPRGADGKCPEEKCKDAKCPSGQTPDPDANCQCIPQKGWCELCTKDADCGLKGKCVKDSQGNQFCAEDCSVSRSCTDNAKYSCLTLGQNQAVCMPVSGSCPCIGTTCPAGQKCCVNRNGLCSVCCDDSDCTAPDVCRVDGTCGGKDKCTGIQCASGQQCNGNTGQCECLVPCPQGTSCDPTANACKPNSSGNQCNPPCQNGMQCCDVLGQKTCMQQCSGPSGPSCKVDSDCQSGQMCCNLMGLGASCMQQDPILKLLCGGGGSGGSCQSDNDCSDPSKPKCCKSAIPIFPSSCQAACP